MAPEGKIDDTSSMDSSRSVAGKGTVRKPRHAKARCKNAQACSVTVCPTLLAMKARQRVFAKKAHTAGRAGVGGFISVDHPATVPDTALARASSVIRPAASGGYCVRIVSLRRTISPEVSASKDEATLGPPRTVFQ